MRAGRGLGLSCVLLLAVAMLNACSVNQVRSVNIKDSDPHLSGSLVFRPKSLQYSEKNRGSIVGGYEQYKAQDNYNPPTGDTTNFYVEDLTLPGAQPLGIEIEHRNVFLAYGHTVRFTKSIEMESRLGATHAQSSIRVAELGNSPRSIEHDKKRWGVIASVTPRWVMNDRVSFEATFGSKFAGYSEFGIDAGAVIRVMNHLCFRVGGSYRESMITTGDEDPTLPTRTDFETHLTGVSAAVIVDF
jgi:hypothetical protein